MPRMRIRSQNVGHRPVSNIWGIALASAALVATTIGTASLPVAAKGPVTIVWAASPISNNGLRAKLIHAFEKGHPGIRVKLQSQPTNTDTNEQDLITTIESGSAVPDVYMGDVIWPAQFGQAGLALPLSSHLPKNFWNRFAPGLVAGATYKGKVYGAPFFMDAGFFYYRKDLLAEAHLPVPHTWAQVVSDSKVLEKDHLVRYGFAWEGASYEGLTCDFMEYLTDAGGKVLAGNRVLLRSPAAVRAVTFMRSLIADHISPPDVTSFQEPQAMNAFNHGEVAFLRNWDYAWSNSQTNGLKGKVGVEPMPTFSGKSYPGYSNIGGWNLYVNPHTKHLAADLTFINWITSNQAQYILATYASEIPTNAAIQKNATVRRLNPVLRIVSKVRLVARPSYTPDYSAVSEAIYTNVNLALTGSISPSTAIQRAAAGIEKALHHTSL